MLQLTLEDYFDIWVLRVPTIYMKFRHQPRILSVAFVDFPLQNFSIISIVDLVMKLYKITRVVKFKNLNKIIMFSYGLNKEY